MHRKCLTMPEGYSVVSLGDYSVGRWLTEKLGKFGLDSPEASWAHLHISNKLRRQASQSPAGSLHLQGQFYESIIYEYVRKLSLTSNSILSVVARSNDAPKDERTREWRRGQDGLFYDSNGSPIVRGDGQDLAEFDILVIGHRNVFVLLECTTSRKRILNPDFGEKIAYKRRLINYLFSPERLEFVLVTPFNLAAEETIQALMRQPSNYLAKSATAKSSGSRDEFLKSHEQRIPYSKKLRSWTFLSSRALDYAKVVERERQDLIRAPGSGTSVDAVVADPSRSPIVKNVILGVLDRQATKFLLESMEVIVEGHRLRNEDFEHEYTRASLGLSFPNLETWIVPECSRHAK